MCPRCSKRELCGPGNDPKVHPRRSRPGGSAPFRTLNPMVTTKRAGGRAGGAFLGWVRGGGRLPREDR
eukprot:9405947-Alexandrium_andersonii.AAC.1